MEYAIYVLLFGLSNKDFNIKSLLCRLSQNSTNFYNWIMGNFDFKFR